MEPKKVSIHEPNHPCNEKIPPEKIMRGAVKFTGALIVITTQPLKNYKNNLYTQNITHYLTHEVHTCT